MGQGIVTLLIAGSILSSLTAMSIAGPRVYYAMARDRLFPDWLSVVDTTRKIPLRAIWFQTFVAIVLVSVGSFYQILYVLVSVGSFYQILYYSGFILIFFASLTVSALFKTSNYRILPVLFIAVNALVLVNATISYPWQAFWGLVTVLAGVPVYLYYKKKLKPEVGKSPRVIYGYTFGQESSGGRQGEVQRAGFRSTGEVKDSA
jgi:APA family basic amino acid/polyamine antiporter